MIQEQLVKKSAIIDSGDFSLSLSQYLEKVEIKSNYELIPLKEIISLESGSRAKGGALDSGIPSIGGAQINSLGKIINEKMKYVPLDHFKSMKKGHLAQGDVLMVKDGATTGTIGFYDGSFEKAAVNEHVFIFRAKDKVLPLFLFYVIRNSNFSNILKPYIKGIIGGVSRKILDIKIPLPPLQIQEQIVNEIKGYQQIIDGCRQVVENYKPVIDIDPSWEIVQLKNICTFAYGKPLKKTDRIEGEFPVYGSNGIVDKHNNFLVESPFIVIGRKGSAGRLSFSNKNGFPIDTTFYISSDQIIDDQVDINFLYYSLKNLDLDKVSNDQTVPGLNRNDAYRKKISLPSKKIQINIVKKLEQERKVIEGNKELIKIYKNKIDARINKVWSDN